MSGAKTIHAIIETATGRIVEVAKLPHGDRLFPGAGLTAVPAWDGVRPRTHYAVPVDGEWTFQPRPACTTFPATAAAPFTLALAAGETIRVRTEAREKHAATSDDPPLRVVDAGRVRVWVSGAFPAMDWSGVVEVT